MLIKNKRGAELGVMILVFLTVFVVTAALFSFSQVSKTVSSKMTNPSFVDSALVKEKEIKINLMDVGRSAVVKSYIEITSNNGYIQNPIVVQGTSDYEFGALNSEVDKQLKDKILLNFDKEIKSYNLKGNLNYLFDGEVFTINYEGEVFSGDYVKDDSGPKIIPVDIQNTGYLARLRYIPKFSIKINLTQEGLETFKNIYNAKEACKKGTSKVDIDNCFKGILKNFIANSNERMPVPDDKSKNYWQVELKTKKSFLINNNLEEVNFAFVLR